MSFINFFGNKVRAKDVTFSNGTTLELVKPWERIDINAGGLKTITIDMSKYNEFMLTVGTWPNEPYRILASTTIPKEALINCIVSESVGKFQVQYSDNYWAGLNYLGNGQIQYRSSNDNALATIWGR